MSKNKSDLTVSGNITILGTPTAAEHAATKDYVDNATPPPSTVTPDDVSLAIAQRMFG